MTSLPISLSSMSVLLIPARLTGVSTCRSVSLRRFFFVKDFAGNPEYHEKKEFSGSQQAVGRRMEVIFKDGEMMVGSTMGHDPKRAGFFLTPADPQGNALRVFVIAAAVTRTRFLQ